MALDRLNTSAVASQLGAIFFWLHAVLGLAVGISALEGMRQWCLFFCRWWGVHFVGAVFFVVSVFKWGLLVRLW